MRYKLLIGTLKIIVRIFFRDIIIKGLENLPVSGALIYTPNHPNALFDPILFFCFVKNLPVRFVAMVPLFSIPVLGFIMHSLKTIPVARRFETEGIIDYTPFFDACLNTLKAGESLVIFPEGLSLPQSRMAALKTGAARLYFLAHEKGVDTKIVPVGFNYEQRSIFRSSLVISIAHPIDIDPFVDLYKKAPLEAINRLTLEIADRLSEHVFQTEDSEDRELLILLERISRKAAEGDSWAQRFERLKIFEKGLAVLNESSPQEIEELRHLLSQYNRLSKTSLRGYLSSSPSKALDTKKTLFTLAGFSFALTGYLFNFMPHRLCLIILYYLQKAHEADMATYKVVYSLFIFPLFYLGEGVLIYILLGWTFLIAFAVCILPVTCFMIFYLDRLSGTCLGQPISLMLLRNVLSRSSVKQLEDLGNRIINLVDGFSSKLYA